MSAGSATALGAGVLAAGCVLAAPYLAGLTRTVPDRGYRRWWRPDGSSRPRKIATAAVGAVLGALAGGAAGWSALLPAFTALALLGTPLVVIDYEQHRLPDRLVVPLAVAAAALLTIAALAPDDWSALGRAFAGAAAAFAALLAVELAGSGAFGFGDVKLGGVLGGYLGWFGWPEVLWGIFAGFLLGALAALGLLAVGRATLRTPVPFGPALLIGALLVLALGR